MKHRLDILTVRASSVTGVDTYAEGYVYVDNGDMAPAQVYRIIGSHTDPITKRTVIELAPREKPDANA